MQRSAQPSVPLSSALAGTPSVLDLSAMEADNVMLRRTRQAASSSTTSPPAPGAAPPTLPLLFGVALPLLRLGLENVVDDSFLVR